MDTERITIARAALAWYGAGWHVLELPPGSKAPPPDGRTGAAGVDMTAAEVTSAPWLGNLGVRMPAGVIGLDVDDYDTKPGAATLDALTAKLGPLPLTWRSSNGRPGRSGIRLFAVPESMRWVAGLPGIDIVQRAHRYAVVWPSMHPEGRQYVLVDELADEPADRIPGREDLPELPWPWIGELSRANDGDELAASSAVSTSEGAEFLDLFDVAAAAGYALVIVDDFLARVRSGRSRHDSMQHALIWAMECARAGIVAAFPVINALSEAWRSVMDVPRRLEIVSATRTTEFDAMLRHAIGKARAKPQREIDALADAVIGIPIAAGTPTTAPGVPAPWGLDADDDDEPAGDGLPVPIVWTTLWAVDERDERPWLVDGFWPAGRQMVVWAAAKTGKSELALWVAAHLASGRHPFTGAPIEPVVVAYLDYEMTPEDLRDRVDDLGLRDLALDRLRYYLLPAMHALDTEAGGAQLEALVTRDGAVAVVIDTFGRTVTGAEDEADTVRAFYRHTGSRLKRAGVGLLRLDHAGKVVERGQRGSSAKRDDVDVIWQLRRSPDGAVLDCTGSTRLGYVPSIVALDRIEGDDSTRYTAALTIRASTPPAVVAKVAELDRLDVDVTFGRDRVRQQLVDEGLVVGRLSTLSAAIKVRRERAGTGASADVDES